jgi:hypothetical protein
MVTAERTILESILNHSQQFGHIENLDNKGSKCGALFIITNESLEQWSIHYKI